MFGFLDETGALASQRDPLFAVGLLRCREPYALLRPIQRIRDRQGFHDEIKWSKVSAKKLPLLRDLVDVFVSADASFSAFVVDKQRHDVISRFGGQFEAYDALARQLVLGTVRKGEMMWIIADEYSTHKVARKLGKYKPKRDLLKYTKKRTGVPTFIGGYVDSRMNVAEYGT